MTSRFPRTRIFAPALIALVGTVAGCTATADLSYGEYQFGPDYETGRTYESRVYGDSSRGFGSEACRIVARREVDRFGEVTLREARVCDGSAPDDPDEL